MNKEVGFLSYSRVDLEEELVINEVLDWVLEIIIGEISIYERKTEYLILEIVIYCLWRSAPDSRRYTCRVFRVVCGVLTLPQLDLQVFHFLPVEVPEDVIVVIEQAGVVVDSVLGHLGLVHIVEVLLPTLGEIHSRSILNTLSIIYCLSNVLYSKEANTRIDWLF